MNNCRRFKGASSLFVYHSKIQIRTKLKQVNSLVPGSDYFVSYNYWPPDFGGELLLSIERLHALAECDFDITVLTSVEGFENHKQSVLVRLDDKK